MIYVRVCIALLPAVLALSGCSRSRVSSPRTSPGAPTRSAPACLGRRARDPLRRGARVARRPQRVRGAEALHGVGHRARHRSDCARRPCCAARWCPAVDHWVRARGDAGRALPFRRQGRRAEGGRLLLLPAMNHVDGRPLSEHGHANAVDISAFVLADGRMVSVKTGWWGASPSAISCAPCTAAPATSSPRCSVPTTTPTIATTSTSTSPATAATRGPHLQVAPRARLGACRRMRHARTSTTAGARPVATGWLCLRPRRKTPPLSHAAHRPIPAPRRRGPSPCWRSPRSPAPPTCASAIRCCRRSRASSPSASARPPPS